MAIASIQVGQNDQRKLFKNMDTVKVNIPRMCYAGIVAFLFTAKMNAMNKIKADKHIVTSRLRNSIYVKTAVQTAEIGTTLKIPIDKPIYGDNEGNRYDADLTTVELKDNEAAFGTNVEYAEKIERLDSFIYWGFQNADDKAFSKEYNRQVNQLERKLK